MALYDAVIKKRPKQRSRPLWIVLLVICLVALLVMGVVISKFQREHQSFIDCMSALSESTTNSFTSKLTKVKLTVDGQELELTEKNAYTIYSNLFNANYTDFRKDIPQEEGFLLEYANGAVLRLWAYTPESGNGRSVGLFVCFTTAEGEQYSYYTDRSPYSRLVDCLSPEKNQPWTGGMQDWQNTP